MCGINGFNWKDKRLIKQMNVEIKHRGPDDNGYYVDQNISLGSVRLAIIDLSPKGHMPMISNDKNLVIVYNGEVYNYREIKKELIKKGYSFKSRTDTEVVLYAYKEWGTDCVKKFNGMWAFAIYDKQKNVLFLSRDRFGIKPLYYYIDKNKFIFSSEIKAILKHNIQREANDPVIFDYLLYNLTDHIEETMFKGIKRLLPGYNLILNLENNKITKEKYYNIREELKRMGTKQNNNRNHNKELKNLLLKSVKRRLISDVPVGSCLSGGIDSSTIVCLMRELNKKGIIKTFSLTFPNNKKIDESRYQKIVIKKAKTEGHFTTPTPKDFVKDFDDFILTQEEPTTTTSVYGQYKIMQLAHKNKMKVLLDGQGSDEIFAGYHYFFAYYFKELLLRLQIIKLINEIKNYKQIHKSNFSLVLLIYLLLPYKIKLIINTKRNNVLKRKFISKHKHRKSKIKQWNNKTLNDALVESLIYYSIPHLLRHEDKNSMRFSIESRVPFLDHELVEFVLSKDAEFKIKKGITKYALRKALEGIVPNEIILRMDKIGFATPEDEWLRNKEMIKLTKEIINSKDFRERKYWNADKIKKLYEKHIRGEGNYGNIIWKVICLERWLEVFKIEDN